MILIHQNSIKKLVIGSAILGALLYTSRLFFKSRTKFKISKTNPELKTLRYGHAGPWK